MELHSMENESFTPLNLRLYILKYGIIRMKIFPKNEKRFKLNKSDDIINSKNLIFKAKGIKC